MSRVRVGVGRNIRSAAENKKTVLFHNQINKTGHGSYRGPFLMEAQSNRYDLLSLIQQNMRPLSLQDLLRQRH